MPLSMIGEGETATITRIGGKEETRRFLENLGFVVGARSLETMSHIWWMVSRS